jgi:hypothetical protein
MHIINAVLNSFSYSLTIPYEAPSLTIDKFRWPVLRDLICSILSKILAAIYGQTETIDGYFFLFNLNRHSSMDVE